MFPISSVLKQSGEVPYPRHEFAAVELTHLRGPYSAVVFIFGGWCHGENNDNVTDKYFNDSFLLHVHVEYEDGVKSVQLRWEKLETTGTPPCPRAGCPVTLRNGKLIFFGGGRLWTDEALHNDCYLLDTATWRWDHFATEYAPTPCQSHALLNYRDDIVLIGGTDNMTPPLHEQVYILNVESAKWTHLAITNDEMEHLYGLSHITPLVSSNNDIYVFSGAGWNSDIAQVSREFYRIKAARSTKSTFSNRPTALKTKNDNSAPPSRFAYGACMVNDTIVLHGGWGFRDNPFGHLDDTSIYYNDTYIYDIRTSTWSSISTNLGTRFGHHMLHLDQLGLIVTIMGRDACTALGDVVVYSTTEIRQTQQVPSSSLCYLPSNMRSQMLDMYQNELLTDAAMCIQTKGSRKAYRKFNVHKCFLSARSPVFRVMFSKDFKEGVDKNEPLIQLPSEDGTEKDLERFLLALYGQKLNALVKSFADLKSVLTLSSKYQVLDIKYECEMVIASKTTYANLLDVLQYADADSCPYLTNKCMHLLRANPKFMRLKSYKEFCKQHSDIAALVENLIHGTDSSSQRAGTTNSSTVKKTASKKRKRS